MSYVNADQPFCQFDGVHRGKKRERKMDRQQRGLLKALGQTLAQCKNLTPGTGFEWLSRDGTCPGLVVGTDFSSPF